jgi:glycosyltransferase involved in cell wall biosynthesis
MNISVVIPLYNKEQYIGRTIRSILAQSVPADEIVVVDDGSTDNSPEEVTRMNDCRVRLVRQQNSGEGAARNRGVAESRNELVAFLDADDEWKPDFLLHIQRLRNNFPDCGAYGTAFEIIDPDGSKTFVATKHIPPAPWIGILPHIFRMMQNGGPLSSSSVVMPKNVFQELGGFPEGITQGADKMLWVRLGMKYPVAYSPSIQATYHRDAMNRACNAFEPEPATARLIDGMLKNNEIPAALLEDVGDYNAYLKIQKARHRVKAGQGKSARTLLNSIRQNRQYSRQRIWWYMLSLMPYEVLSLIQRMRSKKMDPD